VFSLRISSEGGLATTSEHARAKGEHVKVLVCPVLHFEASDTCTDARIAAGLVSNISSGLHEFIDLSREGIKEGRLGKGLALGTGRLAAGTVQGVFGSAAGLSNAMGKGLAQLTFDGDYKRARALLEQNKPAHMGHGVLQVASEARCPLTSLSLSLSLSHSHSLVVKSSQSSHE
jgi:hypothetical protein